MDRIRSTALILGLAVLVAEGGVQAQETTGRLVGRVSDQNTGMALGGITVIVQGPQGEDATLTDSRGDYSFTNLHIGTYAIRFYAATTSIQAEQSGVVVSAAKTVRVNAKLAAAEATAGSQQTYVIKGKAPSVDVGSAQIGTQFDQDFTNNVPLARTYGDLIERAPGAFVDGSGNVSIGGSTGLENIYIVNGINVTGLRFGNLESGASSIGGGSNFPLEFLSQVDVNSGGYQAEYGGAMGGVINSVLKSGSNEFHGSAFGYWAPYWVSADPKTVVPIGNALGGVRKPDFDDSIGVEVGGPIIKDRLFFWAGFAPRFTNSHVFRLTYAQTEAVDSMGNPTGMPALDALGNPLVHELTDWRARVDASHKTYYFAGTLDWIPRPEHKLTLAFVGTPSFNQDIKTQYGINSLSSDPRWMLESLTKTNTDISLKWNSKLFDKRWLIDALVAMHSEYFYDRSPYDDLNARNELQIAGGSLYDYEGAPGCAPTASGFQPCPIAYGNGGYPYYQTGGFGEINKYTGYRWSGELKSTHIIDVGGHSELKYGWHMDLGTFDLDRFYSGPPGQRAFVQLYPPGGYTAWTFFQLPPGQNPIDYTTGNLPATDLTMPPAYVDDLRAKVKGLSNAFFVQESYSPEKLRNLTLNAGVRYELQRIYDSNNSAFLDTKNLGPRLSAVYDPFADGRSKISASYGRYYESVPLDIAARYFGGENFVQAFGDLTTCPGGLTNAANWTGNGEYARCAAPGGAFPVFNSEYAQPHIQGQYHDEIVATVEREVMEDMTVRIDYQHRWLGTIIEDGYGPGFGAGVLGNPGHVSQESLDAANQQLQAANAAAAANPNDQALASAAATAQYNLDTLKSLGALPAPKRTYDALTLSLSKRFSKNWFTHASYTYSRLIGTYQGLYQSETNYIAPNGSNSYDLPELYTNQNGPLPNDRPHLFHLDGFYSQPVGRGKVIFGLSFTARSGMPRNYVGNLLPGSPYQIVMLLPRGSAGRTPSVTQFDSKIAYVRELSPKVNLEAFIDLFNVFNQQTPILVDDNYTFDGAAPIVNGTAQDLKFAKNLGGQPLPKNPNFGQPLAYQLPFHGRVGLRLTF